MKITLEIHTLKHPCFIEISGTLIQYKKQHYIITVHQGLPIKEITIKEKIYTNFIICAWNDLCIIPVENDFTQFVFKHFVKKQIDLMINFIENIFIPINMIPTNPLNLYYKYENKCEEYKEGDAGKSIHSNHKLIGIIAKSFKNDILVIPAIYILRSLEKMDNTTIYTIPMNITKFGYSKVNDMKNIFYRKIGIMMPLETVIALEGDKTQVTITCDSIVKIVSYTPFINTVITNSIKLDIIDKLDIVKLNSCFLHLMKLTKNDQIIISIFKDNEKKEFKISEIIMN